MQESYNIDEIIPPERISSPCDSVDTYIDMDEENEDNDEHMENIEEIDEDNENNENEKKEKRSPNEFSKNSIISISRKAGIKCVSQCGIEKIKSLLHEKIKVMTNNLAAFYTGNGKTVTKQIMVDFLDSEGIHFTHMHS